MRTNLKKIFAIAVVAAAMLTAVPAKSPAQAFGATIVLIDLKQFALELTKSLAASMLNNVTNRYVIGFANNALRNFQIKNPNAYTLNLANQIYTNPALKDLPQDDQFIIKNTVNVINGVSGQSVDLGPLYTKKALDVCNPFAVNSQPAGTATYTTLSACSNPGSVPAQQAVNFNNQSLAVNSTSQQKAFADVSTGQGFKSIYSCTTGTVSNLADCQISKASNVISNRVTGLINSAFTTESNPAGDKYTQYIAAAGKAVGNALATSLLNGITNGLGTSLINDVAGLPIAIGAQAATGSNPALAGPPYSLTKFQVGSVSPGSSTGVVLAGFNSANTPLPSVTLPAGTPVIFEWDASALKTKGADHVIFSNGQHSADVNMPLNSSQATLTLGGIVNYSVTVVDAKGNTLVSDTISITDGSG